MREIEHLLHGLENTAEEEAGKKVGVLDTAGGRLTQPLQVAMGRFPQE